MVIISEKNYKKQMDETVLPFLESRKEEGRFERNAGQPIHYEHFRNPEAKTTLVMVHGFTEGLGKLYETAYYFLNLGMDVWMIQQREHGKSYRSTKDTSLVHVENFMDLIEDLHTFVHKIVFQSETKQVLKRDHLLWGHSMGGGVSACYLETYPDDFERAILSSPMLEMDSGSTPMWVATAAAKAMIAFGKGKNYMPGSGPYRFTEFSKDENTDSKERYDWWNGYCKEDVNMQMCAPSMSSGLQFLKLTKYAAKPENYKKVKAKVLLIQAKKDGMVKPGGQNNFASNTVNTKLVALDAPHEIYRCSDEIVKKYWEVLEKFIEEDR